MIQRPTTFVVGAGASCSFGLPTGGQLLSLSRELTPNSTVYQLLLQSGVGLDDLDPLLQQIRDDVFAESIDDFLLSRQGQPKLVKAGRSLIAALLGSEIARSGAYTRQKDGVEDDWLSGRCSHKHRSRTAARRRVSFK